jgi:hypothetical protein
MNPSAKMRLKLMHTSLLDTCGLWFDVECAAEQSSWSVRACRQSRTIRRTRATRNPVAIAPKPSRESDKRSRSAAVRQSPPSPSQRGHR